MSQNHSIQERREQAIDAPHKRKRQRRKRLFPELPAGTSLPRGEQYLLPSGVWTRDRTLAVTLRKLEAQGISPWRSPLFAVPAVPGLIPISVMVIDGQAVPLYFNPEL